MPKRKVDIKKETGWETVTWKEEHNLTEIDLVALEMKHDD
jgi:hypothetical protein